MEIIEFYNRTKTNRKARPKIWPSTYATATFSIFLSLGKSNSIYNEKRTLILYYASILNSKFNNFQLFETNTYKLYHFKYDIFHFRYWESPIFSNNTPESESVCVLYIKFQYLNWYLRHIDIIIFVHTHSRLHKWIFKRKFIWLAAWILY